MRQAGAERRGVRSSAVRNISKRGRRRECKRIARKSLPHAVQLAGERFIVDILHTALGQDHDVHGRQTVLAKPDGFSDETLEAVTVDGELDILLADHQSNARMPPGTETRERHHTFAVDLQVCLLEYVAEIPGIQ